MTALQFRIKTVVQKHSRIYVSLFLVITAVIVYGQMLGHDFVYFDDNYYVAENLRVRAGLTVDNIQWAFSTLYLEFWHPLTWLSLMLDTRLVGVTPGGHLFTNLLLHILNSLLLFIFFNRATGSVWQSGFSLFTHVQAVTSDNWFAHIALGRDLMRREKFDAAAEQFFETRRSKPNYIPTYINLGFTYARQNKIAAAIAYVSKAERMNSNLVDVQHSLGILCQQQGDLETAHRHFNKALALEPQNATVHKYSGSLLAAEGDLDAAIDHYAESLRVQPGDGRVHYNLGLALAKPDKNEIAVEQYLAALKIEPKNAEAHYNLANVKVKQKKTGRCRRALSKGAGHKARFHSGHFQPGFGLCESERL